MPSQSHFPPIPMTMQARALILALFLLLAQPLPLAAQVLDGFMINNSFTGTVTISGEIRVVAVQPWDGRILIGGNFSITERVEVFDEYNWPIGRGDGVTLHNLARLNNDGTLDTTFAPEPGEGAVNAIAVERDLTDPTKPGGSRIYVGGEFLTIAGGERNGLARLWGADGSLDTGFNPATGETVIRALLLQGRRRLLVGGVFSEMDGQGALEGSPCSNLAGISIAPESDGDLVQTFSGGTDGAVHALLAQDGYLLVGGDFSAPANFLARFDPDDLLDAAFTAEPSGVVRALALQPDGMILVGGEFTSITASLDPLSPLNRNYLTRLTSNGKLTPFDPLLEAFPLAARSYVASIALQPDGRILVGGKFKRSSAQPGKSHQHLARFHRDGTLDDCINTSMGAGTDDTIESIALEPNGRFLVGGTFTSAGGKTRDSLARFYFHGGLDDDSEILAPDLRTGQSALVLAPDGTFIIGGTPSKVGTGFGMAKLNPDLSHLPPYGDSLNLNYYIWSLSLKPDGKVFVYGLFLQPQPLLLRLDESGNRDGFQSRFIQEQTGLRYGYPVGSQALILPRDTPASRPPGAMLRDGLMYISGRLVFDGQGMEDKKVFLKRIDAETGEVDETFQPPFFDDDIAGINQLDDGKILVGGYFTGNLMRLHSDGEPDSSFRPWTVPGAITNRYGGMAVQPDGKIMLVGNFPEAFSPDDPSVKRNTGGLIRLNSDGSVDETFTTVTRFSLWNSSVKNVSLMADGSMVITGVFDEVDDGTAVHLRGGNARLSPQGKVLAPKFFTFLQMAADTLINTEVQPDGKIVICGNFDLDWELASTPLERLQAKYITKVSTPDAATQELTVAPDGSSINWMRGGTSPELWSVWFEEKSASEENWRYLGRGKRIQGGWTLGGQSLPLKENRYVRARGYSSSHGQDSGNGQIVESVRLYYLKEPVRVKAQPETKVYGGANPASYTATYLDRRGELKVLEAGTFHGRPTFGTPATERSGVGNYPIIADVSAMTSPLYSFIPEDGTLTVTKKTLTVTALDATSVPGVANRTFTPGYSGFVGSDTRENSVEGEPELTTVADAQSPPGSYVIVAALGTLRSSNYQFAFQNGTLTIGGRLPQQISFQAPGAATYGDSGVPIVASSNRGLPLTFESSDSSVAVVENGMIVPKRAGSTVITARQGGNEAYEAATPVSHTFTVRKKELKVNADPKARAYRTPNPTLSVSYQGFVNGENSSVVTGTPQLTTAASLESSVGSYPIVVALGTLRADNYFLTPVNGTLTVLNSCQEIVFPAIGERTYGDPPLEITAIACSGLALSFASSNTEVATVSGNLLTITGAGTTVVTASQRGNGDIDPARAVSQSLVVHKRGQSITFGPLPPKLLGDAPVPLDASASSGLPITYLSSDPAVAAVSGSTLTIAGAGTTVITARQEGDRNYEAALPASQPFSVALEVEPPQLSLSTLPSGSATASPVLNVSGSATDNSGITSLTVNSADLTASAALFSSAIPLNIGENSITVTAKDAAGNVASETLSVTLDAAAPLLAVAEPADNSVTDVSLFAAKGSAPPGSRVTMAVNGSAPQAVDVTSGTFNGTGYLQTGVNTVELRAELSERSARAKRTVTLTRDAPPVAITEPGEDLRTEADSLQIKGRAGTGNIGSVLVELNGVSTTVPVEGGVFQQQISLAQAGEYRIKATAADSAGTSSSAWRNIIKVDRIAGDVDRNGVVDIGDALALLRISLGIDPATEQAIAHGDLAPVINGIPQPDGRIGIGDVLILLRKIVGLVD